MPARPRPTRPARADHELRERPLPRPDLDRRVAAAEQLRPAAGQPAQQRALGGFARHGFDQLGAGHDGGVQVARQGLQAARDVHGIADRREGHAALAADVAEHDLAVVQADAHAQRGQPLPGPLAVPRRPAPPASRGRRPARRWRHAFPRRARRRSPAVRRR